jgi:trigger factor
VTLREVFRLAPPSDEELLRELDMPDLATLRADLRRRLDQSKRQAERRRAEDAVLDRILEANPVELPDRILDDQIQARVARLRAHLEGSGATPEETEAELEKERARGREEVAKGIRRFFLLEAIAKKEKLFVTEDETTAELQSIAERNDSSLEEVRRYYAEQELLPALRLDLLETKVRGYLYDQAQRTEI